MNLLRPSASSLAGQIPCATGSRDLEATCWPRISFVNSIYLDRDAISNTLRDRTRRLRRHFPNGRGRVFCYASNVSDQDIEIVRNPGDVLRSEFFRTSDLVVFEYGIHYDLFDLVLADFGIPRVVSFHNVTPSRLFPDPARRRLLEQSERQCWNLRFAELVACNSAFTRDQAVAEYGVDPARAIVVPPSVAVTGGAVAAKAADGPVELLNVGRFVAQKGLLELVEAIALLRGRTAIPFRLTLAGAQRYSDPAYAAAVHAAIRRHGLGEVVRIVGELDDDSLRDAYAAAHAVVLPSHHEGFGVPAIEALSSGCAVVASAAGSLPEAVGRFGTLFPVGDVERIAARLLDLLTDLRGGPEPVYRIDGRPCDQARFGREARAYADEFLPAPATGRFYEALRSLLERNGRMV
ncbi:glycosyltransferase [Roseomonas sp. NAR14]|uniref:Glycosyltransferase n=1 Tax=Roseomonas acroporae TaxID=2937791 RepID=A0A9X1Y2X2_9PROT|nr:glycosyltransferase [Roseomonas acroporae]MCK8782949.1 glycosyltransferase [Roseomonas acroporae]